MNYAPQLLFELFCTTITLNYAGTDYSALILPKGDCSHCCPIYHDDIKFHIYTRDEHHQYYQEYPGPEYLKYLNNGKVNVIYVHGFSEQYSGPGGQEIKNAYMTRNNENVILVDWHTLAAVPWYDYAIKNTLLVAKRVAKLIDDMVLSGIPREHIHLIGFSLGAEIAGLVGNLVQTGKLYRITGLDPAFPLYDPKNSKQFLSHDDAEFVDVIHTDGGVLGFLMPLGHVDFYPNGGTPAQPGCSFEHFAKTKDLEEFVACSHSRAWKYYAATVRQPYAFPAARCNSEKYFRQGLCPIDPTAFMGYKVDRRLRGVFFLHTRAHPPYKL